MSQLAKAFGTTTAGRRGTMLWASSEAAEDIVGQLEQRAADVSSF
jgi:hypothetical protein